MRRKLTALIIAIMSVVGASEASAQFRYGPTVGVSSTNLNFKQDLFQVDSKLGYSAGIAAEMMFAGVGFGIDLGLYYENRGAKLHLGDKLMWASHGLGTETLNLHQIVLPLHLRFKYTRLNGIEDYIAPFLYVGPSFGFNVAQTDLADTMDYAGADLSMDFGIGAEVFKNWQIAFCYNLGLTYTMKAKILTNFSARNQVMGVRLAYLF